jgi:hypothetical protein
MNKNLKVISTVLAASVGLALTSTVFAQGDIPSGTISSSGSGPYSYSLTFADSASSTSPIGSIWYSWVPGFLYLPGDPTTASAPTGWNASIVGNSIQYSASSSTYYITAGSSLSGFGYTATFSPATLASTANSEESVAYETGTIESGPGATFVVGVVPEPSTLALLGFGGAFLLGLARRKTRAGCFKS